MSTEILKLDANKIELAKKIVDKQSESYFRSGIETGVESVMEVFEKTVVDYEHSEAKVVLESMLKICQKETKEINDELEQLINELKGEERILN